MAQHQRASGHEAPCECGGYHYPHRPGSSCCVLNPMAAVAHAVRAGASAEDVMDLRIDLALEGVGSTRGGAECPF